MGKRSAIELLLKARALFPECVKYVSESVEFFEAKLRAFSRWLSTIFIIRCTLVSAFAKAIVLEDTNRRSQR